MFLELPSRNHTECPGIGSSIDPAAGSSMDNVKPMIENIERLCAEDRKWIGFLTTFSMAGAISQDRKKCQIVSEG